MPIRLDQLDQQGAPATPTAPLQTSPPPVGVPPTAEFQGKTVRTPQGTMRFGLPKTALGIAEQAALKNQNPVLTETERERTPMAQTAVSFLDKFAQNLGIDESAGTVKNQQKIAPPMVRELLGQKFQDYAMSEESSMLYNDLESAFQVGAIVLTGRQGDIGKLQQLRDVYAFGGGVKGKPKLMVQKYQNLRRLFQTFDRANTLPPDQRQTVLDAASKQMDDLMGEADPNIGKLQKQFPGATIRLKQQ